MIARQVGQLICCGVEWSGEVSLGSRASPSWTSLRPLFPAKLCLSFLKLAVCSLKSRNEIYEYYLLYWHLDEPVVDEAGPEGMCGVVELEEFAS